MTELVITADGSHTIYVPGMDEHYHSINGAIQESIFIFINNGFNVCHADPLNILEIGFGTGLNAFLTALKCKEGTRKVYYTTIEKYPLSAQITDSLNYHNYTGSDTKQLFNLIHEAEWNKEVEICNDFTIRKIEADITVLLPDGKFDLIYFDAFGPDKQPEMWSKNVFARIASITAENGIFVTYSAKGEVKRNLKRCGFSVSLLPGPPGKRQIIRADKKAN